MSDVRCVVSSGDELGEGPVWVGAENRLYWFDIQGRALNWLDVESGAVGAFALPVRASVAAPRRAGGLILATESGLATFDTARGRFLLVEPMAFPLGFRTNDGKIDVAGRLWWSTMDDDGGKRPGALWRTDPDGKTQKVLDDLHIANTVSCSPDGATLYLADSTRRTLWTLPIAADGSLGERAVFATTQGEGGAPDGSAVDAEGYLWNAQWGAWRIVRYAPDGSVDRIVNFPVAQVSSCAFGGPDLTTLYVTSARERLNDAALAAQPLAGALFAFEPGVAGLPLPTFDGAIGAR
ncbi:MAG: SMP-30/gluconolactonase/LRE family protein [Caulobacterales bacterium]